MYELCNTNNRSYQRRNFNLDHSENNECAPRNKYRHITYKFPKIIQNMNIIVMVQMFDNIHSWHFIHTNNIM